MITLIVGDVTEDISFFAQTISADASLLTKDSSYDLRPGVYYISFGDFDHYRQFTDFLALSNKIIYYPPKRWSDTDRKGVSYMKKWTELALQYFYDKIQIENFSVTSRDATVALSLEDSRKTDAAQIWIAGGSDSLGIGIKKQERYGQLLADHFGVEVSFLTKPGASMAWMADQLIRSDLRSGDIIIYSIVPDGRLSYYHNNEIIHLGVSRYEINPSFNKIFPLPLLDTDTIKFYQPLISLHQVINFCKKIGAQLLIAGLSPTLADYCVQFPNYINLSHYRFGLESKDLFLDVGTDGTHPGPKTHQFYAENIIAKIQQLNFNLC